MYNVNHWINVPVDVEVFEEAKNVLEETIKLRQSLGDINEE